MPAKRMRRTAFKPRSRKSSVRKPYTSRYGNDAFVKVESIEPIATQGTANSIYSTMRTNAPTTAPGNSYLFNKPEFANFAILYARYEIVGMKAEVTLNARYVFSFANLAGGLSPSLPNPAAFPVAEQTLTYPMQVDCNT